jgi:hypothetical protein
MLSKLSSFDCLTIPSTALFGAPHPGPISSNLALRLKLEVFSETEALPASWVLDIVFADYARKLIYVILLTLY